MNAVERMDAIWSLLGERGYLSVEEAVDALSVSVATVRRDFKMMVENYEVEKYHGGIKIIKEYKLSNRYRVNEQEKKRIARKAAELITDGECIFIDSATTTYYMADYIEAEDVIVITNSYLILPRLEEKGIRTYVLNGFIENGGVVMESTAERQLMSFVIDKAFMGVYGISANLELTTYSTGEGDFKRNLIRHAGQSFILADATKFDRCGFYSYDLVNLVTVITDCMNDKNSLVERLIAVQ